MQSLEMIKILHPDDFIKIADAYVNIGDSYAMLGESTKSVFYYYKSMDMRQKLAEDKDKAS